MVTDRIPNRIEAQDVSCGREGCISQLRQEIDRPIGEARLCQDLSGPNTATYGRKRVSGVPFCDPVRSSSSSVGPTEPCIRKAETDLGLTVVGLLLREPLETHSSRIEGHPRGHFVSPKSVCPCGVERIWHI